MDDWVNETRFDERTGKEKRVPVYRGEYYRFDESLFPRSRRIPEGTGGCALFLLPLVLWFLLDFPATRVLYVFLPAALGLFPAVYWILGLLTLFSAPEKMTRLQKEKGPARMLRCAAACALLAAMASLGDLVYLLSSAPPRPEWPGLLLLLCAALSAFLSALRFRAWERQGLIRLEQ